MVLEVPVRVTCPDEASRGEPVEAVLRIGDRELSVWYPSQSTGLRGGVQRRFRPFRGPWPVQFLFTAFCAPVMLFGKRDLSWVRDERQAPCLRIVPIVPSEFCVQLHLVSDRDSAAVARAVEALWGPPKARDRMGIRVRFLVGRWWRVGGLAAVTLTVALPAGYRWMGMAGFFLCVVTALVVEGLGSRNARPPKCDVPADRTRP